MKKKAYIFGLILSLLTIITGCANTANSSSKGLEIAQLQDQIASNENEISQLKEENENYKKFVNSSIEFLDEGELAKLAKNCWSYEISIDDTTINSNEAYKTDKSNFEIVLSEKFDSLPSIEQEIFDTGEISGNFYDHLTFFDIQPSKTYISDGTVVQGMHYKFENVPKSNVIKIQITDELKERLDLEENVISIEVN
ncbi:MAG: hypothetical protein VB018_15750 [Lachnospiraceae bacterium]|nr:hypothetical protein [Lachnospiraceae bacterium]